jgi:hypothetical protein
VVDDRDAVGQLVGLLQVLGGEQDRDPGPGLRGDLGPHRLPAARVQARGRLVQEDDLGRDDQAGGQVQPALQAA